MQKKWTIFLLIAATILVWCSLGIADPQNEGSGEEMCIPMGSINLNPPAAVTPERTSVDFPHSLHFKGYSCDKCHHKWDGNQAVQSCGTSGCHDLATSPEKPLKNGKYTEESIKYYKYAYHNMCRDCHKELKEKRDTTLVSLPTGCDECHPKH